MSLISQGVCNRDPISPAHRPNVIIYFKRLSAKLTYLLHLDPLPSDDQDETDMHDVSKPPQQQRVVLLSKASRIVDKVLSQGLTALYGAGSSSFRWHKERHSVPRSHATEISLSFFQFS